MPPSSSSPRRRLALASAAALCCAAPALGKAVFSSPYRGWTSWDLSAVTNAEAQGYGREFLTAANVIAQSDALRASPLQAAWGARTTVAIDSFWAADPTQVRRALCTLRGERCMRVARRKARGVGTTA